MTVNLIIQDELTLDLLAEVLAKMYQCSLNSINDASAEVAEPSLITFGTDLEGRHKAHAVSEHDLAQAESV